MRRPGDGGRGPREGALVGLDMWGLGPALRHLTFVLTVARRSVFSSDSEAAGAILSASGIVVVPSKLIFSFCDNCFLYEMAQTFWAHLDICHCDLLSF